MTIDVPSPCIRNCCLDHNDICLGCHRTINEIMLWGQASNSQKIQILQQVKLRLSAKEQ